MTNAGLGAVARETSGETLLWTGAARTLLTDASASAAETEETMRVKENISRTLNVKGRGCKKPTSGLGECEDESKQRKRGVRFSSTARLTLYTSEGMHIAYGDSIRISNIGASIRGYEG